MTSSRSNSVRKLTGEDNAALREYFGHGGMAKLEQSPIGYQLAMLERHGRMRKCWVCGGVGRLPPGVAAIRKHADAIETKRKARAWVILKLSAVRVAKQEIGKHLSEYRRLRDVEHNMCAAEAYRRKHADKIREQAESEHGPRGKAAKRIFDAELAAIRKQEGFPDDGWCHFCQGIGWVPANLLVADAPIPTARPTGSSVPLESQMELNDLVIERLGRATRILRRIDPKHQLVFAHYYEPQPMGGARSVWEITPMGMQLLKQHRDELEESGQQRELAPWQVLHEICEQQRVNPHPKRGKQITVMREQAREMVLEAKRAWCEARDATPTRKRTLVPLRARKRIRAPRSKALDQMVETLRELLGAA